MTFRTRRPLLPAVLALPLALPLALAGCASASAPATPTPEIVVSDAELNLTFAAGDDLDADTVVEWGDAMIADAGYEVAKPDAGDGVWAYTQLATGCVVTFVQRTTQGLAGAGDAALSDAALLAFAGGDPAAVLPHVSDDAVPLAGAATGALEVRALNGGDRADGTTFALAVRALGSVGRALVVDVTCPAGAGALDVYDALTEDGSLQAVLS